MNARSDGRAIDMKFDALVIGGGLAGVCAAIEASRSGLNVGLVQDRPCLGGVSSSELGLYPWVGGAEIGGFRYSRESGILEELRLHERYYNSGVPQSCVTGQIDLLWDMVLLEKAKEAGVTVFLNCICTDVVMQNASLIESVLCFQRGTEKQFRMSARVFLDSTGDGSVAYWAGATWRYGREGRAEFQETLAPEKSDNQVLCSSLLFRARDAGEPAKFIAPPWAKVYASEEDLSYRDHKDVRRGYWWIEYGGTGDTIANDQHIYEELLKRLFGVWDHIKNRGHHGAGDMVLEWISALPAKRESRRIIGDHVLCQGDLEGAVLFDDRVAYGGWPMDFHLSEGIDSGDSPAINYFLQEPYSIPLRSLYSADIGNLFIAGRSASVTHVALMSTRVMGTCAMMGQAVGTAMAVCIKHNKTPRQVASEHIEEVQQNILRRDGHIIGVSNSDPDDLARQAVVSASSEATLEILHPDEWHPLDTDRSQIVAIGPKTPDTIDIMLRNVSSCVKTVEIAIGAATDFWDHGAKPTNRVFVEIAPEDTGWLSVDVRGLLSAHELAKITVLANEDVFWGYSKSEIIGTSAAFRNPCYPHPELEGRGVWNAFPQWRFLRGSYCMRFSPMNTPYGPANVISGITRPENGSNIWISSPNSPLPQYVELEFPEEVTLRCIHLTFDTNLTPPIMMLRCPVAETVKDYAIQFETCNGWEECISITDNYQRKRVHTITPVTTKRIRVEIRSTHGCASARVYEIRAYEVEKY